MTEQQAPRFISEFKNPPNEYRLAPFWFWNHRLEEGELIRQMEEMASKGIGGVVMHARHGLNTPYLGPEWMRLIRKCCEKAEDMGMLAWLYDEENWPSGSVGGRVLDDFPHLRMCQIFVSDQTKADGGEQFEWEPETGDGLLFLLGFRDDIADWSSKLEQILDITAEFRDGKISYKLPEGKWRIISFARNIYRGGFNGGYLDVLNPEATARFIEYTHELYTDEVGDFYGKCLKGIFTDEPSTFYTENNDSVQWTDALPADFQKQHGYPFIRALLGQFEETGPETARYRNDFFETVTCMYRDNFMRPMYDYCEKNNIKLIGHVDSEGEYLSHIREQGDFFESAKYMHFGGCDCLFDATWPRIGYSNNLLAPKFASSAAHLLGKERTMCESFGVASGWDLTLSKLKWLADWQVALGINYIIPHAAYYSLEGFRKWECPPDEFYHNPYWPYYNIFAEHLARLCKIFSDGRHRARVAVLSPVAATRAALRPGELYYAREDAFKNNKEAFAIQKMFEDVTETLLRNQYDFDIINEEMIRQAGISDDAMLEINDSSGKLLEDFELLVMPSASVISKKTMEKLHEFAEKGGKIVFVGGVPNSFTETGIDSAASSKMQALLNDYSENVDKIETPGAGFIDLLAKHVFRDVEAGKAEDFIYLRYEKEEGTYFMLYNSSQTKAFTPSEITLRAKGKAYLLNTRTGDMSRLDVKENGSDAIKISLSFAPTQSWVVLVTEKEIDAPAVKTTNAKNLSPIEFKNEWSFYLESDNYLALPEWYVSIDNKSDHRGWLTYGHYYETVFDVKEIPYSMSILADGLMRQEKYKGYKLAPAEIEINGHKIENFQEGRHYDRLVPEAEISALIRVGENIVRVKTSGGLGDAAVLRQPLVLAGRFALEKREDDWFITKSKTSQKTGSWAEQGYPFLSGCAVYKQTINLPQDYVGSPLKLVFENVAETVEVWVNGQLAGSCVWAPWEVNLGNLLVAGDNHFAFKVTNTLHNLFRREAKPSGLLGAVKIVPCK